MGLSNSFVSLGRVAGPIFAGLIFDINPNFPYLAGAMILCVVFVMSLIWVREEERQPPG
jgi:DHA1 family multidrug resistance protein-like MFS transporter